MSNVSDMSQVSKPSKSIKLSKPSKPNKISGARRPLPGWVETLALPIANLLLAFAVLGALLVILYGSPNPGHWALAPVHYLGEYAQLVGQFFATIAGGSFVNFGADGSMDLRPLSNVLAPTTTLIFTGLAVAVAFKAGHFNIGGESQLLMGGLGIALLVYMVTDRFDPGGGAPVRLESLVQWMPDPVLWLALFMVSGLFGALWILIPAYLQAYRGSHIVIATIMFNYIAYSILSYLMGLRNFLSRGSGGGNKGPAIPEDFRVPSLPIENGVGSWFILVALAACGFVYWLLRYTQLGFAIRTTGQNQHAAVYAGMDPRRITVIALCISGALAGLGAGNHVLTKYSDWSFSGEFVAGLGFLGIAVALLARNNPLVIPLTALVFGVLVQAGTVIQTDTVWSDRGLDSSITLAVQGLIVLFVGAFPRLGIPVARWIWNRTAPPPQRPHEAAEGSEAAAAGEAVEGSEAAAAGEAVEGSEAAAAGKEAKASQETDKDPKAAER